MCMHVHKHVVMSVFLCVQNNQVISLRYVGTKELNY